MNNGNHPSERQLLERLAALPLERAPTVDLWPSIQARLGQSRRGSPWWSQAVAAILVAALGLAVVRIGGDRQVPADDGSQWPVAWQDTIGADLEYSGALRDLRGLAALDESRLPLATRDEFLFNLRLVEQASRQLRAAIEQNPDASYLTGMLANLERKRLDVLRDLALSSSLGEEPAGDYRRAS